MIAWLSMGGYGAFVWPAYLLTAGVLLWNLWAPLRSYRKLKQEFADATAHGAGEDEIDDA